MEESKKKDPWIEIKKVAEESTYGIGGLSRLKYHWEFLRRNTKYIEAYNKFKDSLGDSTSGWKNIRTAEFNAISFPMDPDLSFEEVIEQFTDNSLLPTGDPKDPTLFAVSFARWLGMISPIQNYWDYNSDTRLIVKIDFERVNSLTKLKKDVGKLISEKWNAYEDASKRKSKKMSDNFNRILKIGDLVEKEKFEKAEVARQIFADEDATIAYNKVVQDHKRYLEMIEGGYKEL